MTRLAHAPTPALRLLAAGCALLVLALSILSASPAAHAWLHDTASQHTCTKHAQPAPAPVTAPEHDCAITLFASGTDLAVAPLALTPPSLAPTGVSPVTAAEFYLVSPRYLRQPERGPPASRLS